ncbi:MAG TPA: AAA family ATPase [Candidatus Angelobacter sp.]|jgi:predicted ATPase|nr:AAA family ATPase [Candidatus Angelobacter sp.]
MLKRIKIRNYKSFFELDLELKPLSVLFGPNSAGKSNFLDALQLLSRMATKPTLKEAFDPPYRGTPLESLSFKENGIPDLLHQDSVLFSFEVDVEISDHVAKAVDKQIREMRTTKDPESSDEGHSIFRNTYVSRRYLRYRLEVEVTPRSGMLRVNDEYLAALNTRGEPVSKPMPFLEKKGRRLHLRMEGQAHPTYHETHLDHTILSRSLYAPHYPHLVAMRQELSNWLLYYFEPRERMRAPNPVKEVRNIGQMGEDLGAFLNTLKAFDPKQFNAIEKSVHQIIPNISGIDVSVNNLGEVELSLKEANHLVPARIVSEGTLRILGLLALGGARETPALIGFEEPENGIHPRRIKLIAELLQSLARNGDTQLIITTHSPLLPDLIPDESLFVCRKVKGKTIIEPFVKWGPLYRTNQISETLDAEEAPEQGSLVSERILRGDFDA